MTVITILPNLNLYFISWDTLDPHATKPELCVNILKYFDFGLKYDLLIFMWCGESQELCIYIGYKISLPYLSLNLLEFDTFNVFGNSFDSRCRKGALPEVILKLKKSIIKILPEKTWATQE